VDPRTTVDALLETCGQTYADAAGIKLADLPSPLYQLLVLTQLLSARISGEIAVAGAKELFAAGCRTPRAMLDTSWRARVTALDKGHYVRYDDRTATMLGDSAQRCVEEWKGDLRRLHARAPGDVRRLRQLLQQFPGIGPTGADIFLREVQAVWPDVRPYVDARVRDGAAKMGLPTSAEALADLVEPARLPNLAAALVRVARSRRTAEQVQSAVGSTATSR
jgi:endonuclease III